MAPIPFQLALALLLGLLFALAARAQFAAGHGPWGRELQAILIFEGLVAWPVIVYSVGVHPAWSWLYLVDPRRLPRYVVLLLLLAHAIMLVVGYLVGWLLIRRRRLRALALTVAGVAVCGCVAVGLLRGRYFVSGTYDEFRAGRAAPASERKLSWAASATGLSLLCAAAVVAYALREQGRRYRSGS